jgi:hypothetical protein
MVNLEISEWDYHGDFEKEKLSIAAVDPDGTFRGSIASNGIRGKFLESTREITFVRQGPSDNVTHRYTGFMTRKYTATDGPPEYFLAGSYIITDSSSSELVTYGWFATKSS